MLLWDSRFEMKKSFVRLGSNSNFRRVYRYGKSKANKLLVMIVLKRESGPNSYGFSVSKKVGNSVVRHHITRLLRESVRELDARVENSYDIVIVARSSCSECGLKEIKSAVEHLFKIHGILK